MPQTNDCAVAMLDAMRSCSPTACSADPACRKQVLWETIYIHESTLACGEVLSVGAVASQIQSVSAVASCVC